MGKFFSYKNRPMHLGPYPLEDLARTDAPPDLGSLPNPVPVAFQTDRIDSIVNAMRDYQAMLDATRDGIVKAEVAAIPLDPQTRSDHLKAFGYYCDASMVGICKIPPQCFLPEAIHNPDVQRLSETLASKQTSTLASGIDVILAGLRESLKAGPKTCTHHTHAIVFLYEHHREPKPQEPGATWITNAQTQRACLRAAETVVTLASYIRLLGREARGHSGAASDVHLAKLAVTAGLATIKDGAAVNPFLGADFGIGVITTTLDLAPDKPLHEKAKPGRAWRFGIGPQAKNARNRDPYLKRNYKDGAHPFETLKRTANPTTYIDEINVARVPKRTNMFARSLFGDLGKTVQDAAKNGNYVRKSAAAFAFRGSLAAFTLIQDGKVAKTKHPSTSDAAANAADIKAAAYYLGCDAVGLSRCPDWAYYSHDAAGQPITPYHKNAISIIIDQGHETMEGASGDDWIACAQSMRAYLRFSLLGGVLANHIRNLGFGARTHTVMDDEVLHPPLLLLAGLGEVSRIGEVILNPFLGPRLKSGVVTTNMPVTHDQPIDFGLQRFCAACNKCARECPSGAITAGPKLMFNGYEIWKSDSQKCTTYRLTTKGGAMCGRCMKTCPWNLEGLFAEKPFRWAAMKMPGAARVLAKLDDALDHGAINPVKRWWWDLEMVDEGPYDPSPEPLNQRGLSKDLNLKYEDQTLAVYPAPLATPPFPWPFPMDREAGIKAYQNMIPAQEHIARRKQGQPPEHIFTGDQTEAPVIQVVVSLVKRMTKEVTKYEFKTLDGALLPKVRPGAHIDVVVAPEFFRQFSLSGDPADRSKYQIAVLREGQGRGGSQLMHRIFEEGRKVFISKPLNHFPLSEDASKSYLMGGGIGVTPLISMAHRLYRLNADFEMHYSCSKMANAGFLKDLSEMPWSDRVHLHFSDKGSRAFLSDILRYKPKTHVYTCGPEAYMQSVLDAATANGFAEENRHMEYFSVPDLPEYQNFDFILKLSKSGREIPVPADKSATDVLIAAGIPVDVKCSDGLCGVCKCGLISGDVEHRDFVLSNKQRQSSVILCQSRAAKMNGVIEVDL